MVSAWSDQRLPTSRGSSVSWPGWVGQELLYPEALDDVDSEDEWYGLPTPNSAARLMAGTAGAPSLPTARGWTRLVRGGGGRDVSTLLGLLDRSAPIGRSYMSLEGFLARSGRGPGAEGVRDGVSAPPVSRGKVPARFPDLNGSGSNPS